MKIEKISDNQIRCTLTSADLAARQIKLSELVYGSQKTKKLFQDMVMEAHARFGFEAEETPLMVEAIPVNSGCLVLVITKVDDPEELDTRFSNFAQGVLDEDEEGSENSVIENGINGLMDLLSKLKNAAIQAGASAALCDGKNEDVFLFSFADMDDLLSAAAILENVEGCKDVLYRDPQTGRYALMIARKNTDPEKYNRICNTLSEYGKGQRLRASTVSYLEEHEKPVIKNKAIEALCKMQQASK
ncbi:MAG: adaptor protein MecA [Lachnospiraceae bacterium]|nr:adaptor protein MecA [Candidatus Merdinaster equi]